MEKSLAMGVVEDLRRRLRSLVESRRNLVVLINGVPEISRPLALELISAARGLVASAGGKWLEDTQALYVSPEYVVLAHKVRIELGQGVMEVVEVGEASKEERGGGETLARRAHTRAVKRVLEALVGEDFINQVLAPVMDLATDGQKAYLRSLIERGRIGQGLVERFKKEGKVKESFVLEDESTWDRQSVSALLDAVRGRSQ